MMTMRRTHGPVGSVPNPRGSKIKPCRIRNMNERSHNNEMHGTPQGYLSYTAAERSAASMDVKRRSTGARDLNAVIRHPQSRGVGFGKEFNPG